MQRVLHIVLALWAGSLWTVCGFVAPSLFAVVSDRHVAGQVAGHFFRLEAWLGLVLGAVTLALLARRAVAWATRFDYWLLTVAALAPLSSELVLRQLMNGARAAGNMGRFGLLHGLSAMLFGVACIAALVLVWRLSAPPPQLSA